MIQALDAVALAIGQRDTRKQLWRQQVGEGKGSAIVQQGDMNERLIKGLTSAQLFDVDNIHTWVRSMDMSGDEAMQMMIDLPCCLPVYPFTYMEWSAEGVRSSAYCVMGSPGEDGLRRASVITFDTNEGNTYLLGAVDVAFDEQGVLVRGEGNRPQLRAHLDTTLLSALKKDDETMHIIRSQMLGVIATALFTNSLLHCKNVKEVVVDPRKNMSRQQLREADRKHRKMIIHKVLEINPLRKYRVHDDQLEGEGEIRRLHHVRGHFSEYGPEYGRGLLFGRISGRFFIPPHVRGELQAGVIDKTYSLKTRESCAER